MLITNLNQTHSHIRSLAKSQVMQIFQPKLKTQFFFVELQPRTRCVARSDRRRRTWGRGIGATGTAPAHTSSVRSLIRPNSTKLRERGKSWRRSGWSGVIRNGRGCRGEDSALTRWERKILHMNKAISLQWKFPYSQDSTPSSFTIQLGTLIGL